jgi:hypothetical protein
LVPIAIAIALFGSSFGLATLVALPSPLALAVSLALLASDLLASDLLASQLRLTAQA